MIRKISYLLLLLALPLLSLANEQIDALLAKGNNFYAKAKYQEAASAYQSILNEGYQSAVVYFNLGNAYYKLGEIPSAILYYEKAHRLSPGDEDISFNIQLANLKTTDKIEAAPEFFLAKWWDGFILCASVGALAWFTVIFLIVGFSVLIAYLYAQSVNFKRTSFYTAIVFIALGLITLSMAAIQAHYFASHHEAILFSHSATVKSEPGAGAKTVFVIHEGTKVSVSESSNGWERISLANGNEGWVLASDIKDI